MKPKECIEQINDYVKSGQKIQAIKLVRQLTGLGLKEAK
jgi:ribosomal protein L7/L12